MKFSRDQFTTELRTLRPGVAVQCHAAEGGTSGKNSTTDQRQVQATSQTGPVFTGDGPINTGTSISNSGSGKIEVTDQGAVAAAFDFGKEVILANSNNSKENVESNQAFLDGVTKLIASNSAGGANENQNKLLLYLGIGALAVFALLFFRR